MSTVKGARRAAERIQAILSVVPVQQIDDPKQLTPRQYLLDAFQLIEIEAYLLTISDYLREQK